MLNDLSKEIWENNLSNKWDRLSQGNTHWVRYTDTIDFIHIDEVPNGRYVTYVMYVLDYRPLKGEPYRVKITISEDRLKNNSDAGSPAANLLETKALLNSTISDATKSAHFMTADIQDYFLTTPMSKTEHMKVQYNYIPEDI